MIKFSQKSKTYSTQIQQNSLRTFTYMIIIYFHSQLLFHVFREVLQSRLDYIPCIMLAKCPV